jgi:restriction system protein
MVRMFIGQLEGQIKMRDRRHLVDWTTDLSQLSAHEFEWLVGEAFRREGWSVEEVGRHGQPDGNIDLELRQSDTTVIVQCKRWHGHVGVKEIRELAGTLMRDGTQPTRRYLVALAQFSEAALEEANRHGIWAIDGKSLRSQVDKVRRREPCPECGSAMELRRSQYGWWLRCPVRGCKGKRNLDKDAGKAVRLLVES